MNQKQAGAALDAITSTITEALQDGESVQILGFGTFEMRTRAARTTRNPRTGEKVEVAAKKVPAFKAAKSLKEALK